MSIEINQVLLGDCLELLSHLPDNSVDLVITSPPYEAARTYGIDFKLKGQEWVDWSLKRFTECHRVCKGLVAWVVEGQTLNFRYSATPALLMADLHRSGIKLRKPPIFKRVGIPESGGPDWWRNDYEFIICSSKGKLPWSNNTAIGTAPKYRPGGKLTHRQVDGTRKSQDTYKQPSIANPGNIVSCVVGGGRIGSSLAHKNEAPFPEKLAEAFILSFCPIGGTVLDPFCGSGTSLAVAVRNGRNYIGMDLRQSQIDLSLKRIAERTN